MEDWALIRRLVADGVPQRQVARDLGVGRSTVARALASDGPPKYVRAAVPTSFVPFEPAVRQLLAAAPDMPASVIAERVGWTGSITWFRDNVRRLRPEHLPVDPSDRLVWLPGDAAQCDLWFPPKKIPLEDGSKTLLPVMVITAAHTEHAEQDDDREEDLRERHRQVVVCARERRHQQRRDEDEEGSNAATDQKKEPEDRRCDPPGAGLLSFLEQLAEDGNKGGGEGRVGDEGADQVRDLERDREGVDRPARAEVVGGDDFANEPEDA